MHQRLSNLCHANVLVVGDLILDRYWYGATGRISPEAPVPVVLVEDVVDSVGGAANVAANIVSIGGQVQLVGVIGDDSDGDALERLCIDIGIEPEFLRASDRKTTVKLRVVSQRQQLIRLDFEQVEVTSAVSGVVASVSERMSRCDVVVVSDYAKGAANRVSEIIEHASALGLPVIVDPKGADFSRYAGASLLTPNLKEFEAVVGTCRDDATITEKATELITRFQLEAVLVTRGAAGMSLFEKGKGPLHIPAHTHEVFDVTGAGDTVCAVIAAALATGCDLPTAVGLANTAASLAVGKFGASTVTIDEIDRVMVNREGVRRGMISQTQLREEFANARRRDERVVMTNGCFDLFHAGHARYLKAAKALGQRLVVAVNDDDSVRKLKGDARPINGLAARMEVLAALDCVDWVIPFSDPTPRNLIAELLPDILVKGGDYKIDAIAGGAEVTAAGGEVVVLDYHDGFSSSSVIDRLTNFASPSQ
jgi:D-beta-D-heptose 7-phosphate kinase / D-beta-D-heptose 1-phosphate adenosyltransferase